MLFLVGWPQLEHILKDKPIKTGGRDKAADVGWLLTDNLRAEVQREEESLACVMRKYSGWRTSFIL